MSTVLPLLRKEITLDEALHHDDNILAQLEYPRLKHEFWSHLEARIAEIEAAVCLHLHLTECQVAEVGSWIAGSYNVCIPVYVGQPSNARVLVRIPLPYKVGERQRPGNADEKLRCEVASYIWIQDNCPDIPIPTLFGFGLPSGQTFTIPQNVPLIPRLKWAVRRTWLSWLAYPTPCQYVARTQSSSLNTGYLIISFVEHGRMLSDTWGKPNDEKEQRSNLFHGLARILLSLSRCPLPRIGSLVLDDYGVISLTNRPLTLRLQTLENEGIPTTINRTSTYSAVEPYILDYLGCHDNRIRHQPNSIHSQEDGEQQLAALAIMRSVLSHFASREFRHGPFVLTLTDLHQSNIFVDDEWNITSLIDLEWACSLPIELQCPPYWLTGRPVDDLESGEALETFSQAVAEYLDIFEEEESRLIGRGVLQAPIMRKCWASGAYWYFQAVNSPKGMFRVFLYHVQPLFCSAHSTQSIFDQVVSRYWSIDAGIVIDEKLKDEIAYKDRLREKFAAAM